MEFKVVHKGKTFNIELLSKGETFLSIRNCRIVQGKDGPFVSGPAAKMEDGQWFNYLYMTKDFSSYILQMAEKHQTERPPQRQPERQRQERQPVRQDRSGFDDMEDSIPF